MRAGLLNKEIYIQTRTTEAGEFGENTDTWSDAAGPIWAAVEPAKGRELNEAATTKAEVTHVVRFRFSSYPTMTPDKRIRFGARTFEVTDCVNRFERGKELVLSCVERV